MATSLPERKFSRVRHVRTMYQSAVADGLKLSTSARYLGVVLADLCRLTVDGEWLCWPGRARLAKETGLDKRTIATARGQLEDAGIFVFRHAKPGTYITTDQGKQIAVKPGLVISVIAISPAAVRQQRAQDGRSLPTMERKTKAAAIKARARQEDDATIHAERLELGKKHLRGELDRDAYDAALALLKNQTRETRRARWPNATQV